MCALQIKKMNHKSEIPQHSAKRLVRRLQKAGNRHSRNMLLSSIRPDEFTDVE